MMDFSIEDDHILGETSDESLHMRLWWDFGELNQKILPNADLEWLSMVTENSYKIIHA